MKLSKKLLATALLLAVCFAAVSAGNRIDPTSMTNESSQGLFGTDVDDYLDVNEWSNVQPTKVFGFLSYGKSGTDKINTGFAMPVGKFYLGAFFGGQLNSWTSEVGTRTGAKQANGSFSASSTTTTNQASGSVLFGFNNIGILGNITYKPGLGNRTDHHKTLGGLKLDSNNYTLDVAVKAGFNVTGPKDILFKTSAEVGITSKVNKTRTTTKSPDTYTMVNGNEHDLHINGGVYFDFAHNGPVTQGASLSLNTDWTIYPTHTGRTKISGKTTDTYMYGQWHDTIKLEPSWSIIYEPEGSKVALKAKVGVPIAFDTKITYNYTKTTDGNKAYNPARTHTTTIDFTPELKAGLTYAPIDKIRFNVGAKVSVPSFGWNITKTENRKADDGSIDADKGGTVRSFEYHFNTADGKIGLASGFTWFITQNVTFDANWDLTDNLLNGFSHKLPKDKNLWETINKVLVHKVGFMLSVKL